MISGTHRSDRQIRDIQANVQGIHVWDGYRGNKELLRLSTESYKDRTTSRGINSAIRSDGCPSLRSRSSRTSKSLSTDDVVRDNRQKFQVGPDIGIIHTSSSSFSFDTNFQTAVVSAMPRERLDLASRERMLQQSLLQGRRTSP